MALKVVVVGCGFIGATDLVPGSGIQSHAAAWFHHPGAQLVGLCDPDPARLAAASMRWRPLVASGDLDQVLRETNPDLVSIATPDDTHAAVLERVLARDGVRAVLVEKPLALDLASARRVAALAEGRGVVCAVNYSRRYAPSHRLLKKWLDDQPLGPLEAVRGCYVRGLKHNGTHWIDLARWLVGEIIAVQGRGAVPDGAVDATIDADFEFAGGARGSLVGLADATYSLFEMDLIGRHGRLIITDGGQRFQAFRGIASRHFPGFRDLAPIAGPQGGLADLVMHAATDLIEAVTTGPAPAGTLTDALAALTVAEEALTTAQRGVANVATIGS
jgi:predicted dehydrogenase